MLQAETVETHQEMNEVLISILRHVCEQKQLDHAHISDSNKNLSPKNTEVRERGVSVAPFSFIYLDTILNSGLTETCKSLLSKKNTPIILKINPWGITHFMGLILLGNKTGQGIILVILFIVPPGVI